MKKRSAILIVAIALYYLPNLYACKKSKEKPLVIVDSVRIDKDSSLERVSSSIIASLLLSSIYYTYDSGASVHNVLAEDVKMQPDNRTVEIKLKDGVRFHDGRPLTSEDIILSLNRIKSELGNKLLNDVEATVVDRLTFRLQCGVPMPSIEALLSAIAVVPSSNANLFIGTGPYKFKRWLENGVELEANSDYFEGPPGVKKIVYLYEADERKRVAMLLKGEADFLVRVSPDVARFLKKDERFNLYQKHEGFYTALFFNNKSPLFSDKAVRKAISMTIDRNAMVKKALNGGGMVVSSPFPPELLPVRETDSQSYRPKEALRLLRNAGWKDIDGDGILEKNGRKLTITLHYIREAEELKRILDIIGQCLFEAGIGLKTEPVDINEINDVSGDCESILMPSAYDENFNVKRWFSGGPKDNISHYANTETDRLLVHLQETESVEEKKNIYGRLRIIFDEDAPAAFLYAPTGYIAVNKRFKSMNEPDFYSYSFYSIKDWETERR